MEKDFIDIFFNDGYRFYKAAPEGIGAFYKYYEQGFHVVLILEESGALGLTPEQIASVQERIQELFYHPKGRIQDFPDGFPVYHVELLTIYVTGQEDMARHLCSFCKGIWVYDTKQKRLRIYENQPGDFFGLRELIENSYEKENTKPADWRTLPFVTILIAAVNVAVYLILSAKGSTQNGLYMASNGAMYPDFITYNHQFFRFITCMFLHFGVTHLMNNMVIFCCVGSRLEKIIGHLKMAVVYLGSGIGGGVLSYLIMLKTGDYAVSAGASGAVFGIIGGLLWVVILHRGNIEGMTTRGMILMLVLSLYFGFTTAGVDNWCHIGGLLTGFFLTIIFYHRKRQTY